jgi:enoyl-CoA hydratase/carnithine racemase
LHQGEADLSADRVASLHPFHPSGVRESPWELNRPDKLNAYTATMGRELADAFMRADEDDQVRVVVVTGAGRGFCAGADISAGAGSFDTGGGAGGGVFGGPGTEERRRKEGFAARIYNCRKPSICAINGPAVGVGITLTLPMDIRIAAKGARIGFIFARRGLVPEAGSAWFLPRIVGLSQALSWCLSGALIDAEEALRGGLVSEVVAPDTLLPRAKEIAREIADNTSPVAIALTRQMLWRFTGDADPFRLLEFDAPLSRELGATADVREGVSAFLEKRKPAFPGRVSADMPKRYPWWTD